MAMKSTVDETPIRFVTDERLDFARAAPLRKSYIIASSYRCGGQYLSWKLWQTGLLGAPCEYFNPGAELRILKKRFNVFSHADYVAKVIERRTSRNGVFGLKAHFHQFESFLEANPSVLDALSPVSYIFLNRLDKVAQAVSMAKALQTGQWTSRMEKDTTPVLRYDPEMIARCLVDIEQQDLNWIRWFETRRVTPFHVTYDDLTADVEGVVRSIVELLGVQNDECDVVNVPPAKKQADETNEEWIGRFQRETASGGLRKPAAAEAGQHPAPAAEAAAKPAAAGAHFFDRYGPLIESIPNKSSSATGFISTIRLRRRYDAIIGHNRALFQGARVLDIASAHGFWTLAALDAGAAHVVGIESSKELVQSAEANFKSIGIKPESYQFSASRISAALERFDPGSFDVILCKGHFEQCHFTQFFHYLARLGPKHVVLDTRVVRGHGPTIRFSIEGKARKGRDARITSTPNHKVLETLCEDHFRLRLIDWKAMGDTDWTGVQDYASDTHRTYVLDRLAQ